MKLERVRDLLDLMSNTPISELVLVDDDGEIRLKRDSSTIKNASNETMPSACNVESTHHEAINAPLPGIVYLSSAPDAAPYISIGNRVKKGDTLALIEAMKTLVPITAHCDGVVAAILVGNIATVERAQILFNIAPSSE